MAWSGLIFIILLIGYFLYSNNKAKNTLLYDMPQNKSKMTSCKHKINKDREKMRKEAITGYLDIDSVIELEIERRLYDLWDKHVTSAMANDRHTVDSRNKLYLAWHGLMAAESSYSDAIDAFINIDDRDGVTATIDTKHEAYNKVMANLESFNYDAENEAESLRKLVTNEINAQYNQIKKKK
jgi:hypothetical protein